MTEFDWEIWSQAEEKRHESLDSLLQQRLERALKEAQRIALLLVSADLSLHKIILFGSVGRQNPTHLDFDIDLALEGAASFATLEALGVSKEFLVDLVEMEHLGIRIRENILREGKVLYER